MNALKKYNILLLLLLLIVTLAGCNLQNINLPVSKEKPSNYYYTNLLSKDFKLESNYKIVIFETNLFKEKQISKDDSLAINGFLKDLRSNDFINKPRDLPAKPAYKIFITFNKDKFVINVYTDRYVSIYPWDGVYSMDYIDMSDTLTSNNLYYLCNYIIPKHN